MYSPEGLGQVPQEVIAEAEQAQSIEQPAKEYNPTAEQLVKTFDGLGLMADELPGEDPKLEFIVSLNLGQEEFAESLRKQKAKYKEAENEGGVIKLARIYGLRKEVLGFDPEAEQALELAYGYLNTLIDETAGRLRRAEAMAAKTDRDEKLLRWLLGHRLKIGRLIAKGYPELWEKIKPKEEGETAEAGGSRPETEEQIDLQRLGFTETTFQRLPTEDEKSGKTETFAFQKIAGNHSWESGLKAARNKLKQGIALGLKVKYPDRVQALHLLREMKRQVGRETNVGTFIDQPGEYMVLHGDNPTTRTIALDRSIDHYPNTEMMVLVVPDTKAVPDTAARPGKKVA